MNSARNVEIDCLRGVAIIVTVLAHTRLLFLWKPDWLTFLHQHFLFGNGVDLFFVISGLVITNSLTNKFLDKESFHNDYKNFLIRRFHRLAPAALFFCAFYILYSQISRSGEVGGLLLQLKNTVAVITLTANMRDQSNLMAVYWTLASEWQFYLTFPIFLLMVHKGYKWAYYGLFLALLLLFAFGGDTFFVKLRFDAMLYGVALALFMSNKALFSIYDPVFMRNRLIGLIVTGLSIMLLIFLPVALTGIPTSILMGLVSLNCAFLVWIAAYERGYLFGGYLRRTLSLVGSRSYSIYLAHGPAIYLTHDFWYWWSNSTPQEIGGTFTFKYMVTFLFLVVVISELSFRWWEKPFIGRPTKALQLA